MGLLRHMDGISDCTVSLTLIDDPDLRYSFRGDDRAYLNEHWGQLVKLYNTL